MNSDRSPFVSFLAGAVLPLAQAVISGFVCFCLALAGALLSYLENPWQWGLFAGAGAAAVIWFSAFNDWRRVVYRLEPTQGEIQEEDWIEEAQPVRVELSSEEGRKVELIDLPANLEQLTALAVGLLNGASLSEAAWTGSGAPFTRAEFARLRNEFIRRGLACWNNPRTPARGASLTPGGRACIRYLASMADFSPSQGLRPLNDR